MGFMTQVSQRPCTACGGTGQIATTGKTGCGECGGRATYTDDRKAEITLPPGIADHTSVSLTGLGEQPVKPGDIAGDLVLEVQVLPDSNFRREGPDLIMEIPVTFAESVLGKTITVPHFGGAFEINTLSEFGVVAPGEVTTYTVSGKGMPKADASGASGGASGGAGARGDLRMRFKITEYPKKQWTETEREALTAALTTVR
jgi:molecular chaperone DnaJ